MSEKNSPGDPSAPTPPKKSPLWSCLTQIPAFRLSDWLAQLFLILVPLLCALVGCRLYLRQDSERRAALAGYLFWSMVVVAAILLVYLLYQFLQKKGTPPLYYGVVSLLCVAWLLLCVLINAPQLTIRAEDPLLLFCAFAAIPIFYSMIRLIRQLHTFGNPLKSSLIALVATPLIWYLLVNTVIFSAKGTLAVIVLLMTIAATYFFIFLLLYTLYLTARHNARLWKILRLVMVFVMPILCFAVTQIGSAFDFFWDYTSLLYYLLVIVNGVLLVAPEPGRKALRLLLFLARSGLYLVVTYFFVVIAPFYSLSLVGLLIAGLGLLVLTPLFLWAYQTKVMLAYAKALWKECGKLRTVASFVVGLAAVPLIMAGAFLVERSNLYTAIDHMNSLNTPSAQTTKVNGDMLCTSLRYIRSSRRMELPTHMLYGGGYDPYRYIENHRIPPPFITLFHNKVIGSDHIQLMMAQNTDLYVDLMALYTDERYDYAYVYVEDSEDYSAPHDPYDELIPDEWDTGGEEPEEPPTLELGEVEVETKREGEYYRSFVHLTLKDNRGEEDGDSLLEYYTHINLPAGVFVSDYYLDVFGQRKPGLLAETTSANWVYNVITSSFLDPGLVQYTGKGISLNVFPFSPGETRYTGIEFLHREPLTLDIDGKTAELAPEAQPLTQPVEGENVLFIGATAKELLPDSQREPYYLFVVDCSFESDVESLSARLENFVSKWQIPANQASVSAVNYNRGTWSLEENWQEELLRFPRVGGFGYGMMTDQMFREVDMTRYYPVLVVLESAGSSTIALRNIHFLMQSTPEVGGYFGLGARGIYQHEGFYDSYRQLDELPEAKPVKMAEAAGTRIYVPADSGAEIYCLDTFDTTVSAQSAEPWLNALNFYGDQFRIRRIANKEEQFAAMLEVIKKSFAVHVMSPYTNFIVLENEAQEQTMLRRQEMLLKATSWEDFYESTEGMTFAEEEFDAPEESGGDPQTSEPGLLLSLALLTPFVILYRRKQQRLKQSES